MLLLITPDRLRLRTYVSVVYSWLYQSHCLKALHDVCPSRAECVNANSKRKHTDDGEPAAEAFEEREHLNDDGDNEVINANGITRCNSKS